MENNKLEKFASELSNASASANCFCNCCAQGIERLLSPLLSAARIKTENIVSKSFSGQTNIFRAMKKLYSFNVYALLPLQTFASVQFHLNLCRQLQFIYFTLSKEYYIIYGMKTRVFLEYIKGMQEESNLFVGL